ncbi:MAG: hypothetical protein ABSG74_09120 [Candidatus Bathyarchaeia archaeon]|jgi:hypothetical protein
MTQIPDVTTLLGWVPWLIGGSGVAGWFFSWLSLREERKEKARARFTELVMKNSDFVEHLALLGYVTELISDIQDFKEGKKVSLRTRGEDGKSIMRHVNDPRDLAEERDKKLLSLSESFHSLRRSAVFPYMFPKNVWKKWNVVYDSIAEYAINGTVNEDALWHQLNELSKEIRRTLGL